MDGASRAAFGAKLSAARRARGWSQSELGPRIGLTRRALSQVELGQRRMAIHDLWPLRRAFDDDDGVGLLRGWIESEGSLPLELVQRDSSSIQRHAHPLALVVAAEFVRYWPVLSRAEDRNAVGTLAAIRWALGQLSQK